MSADDETRDDEPLTRGEKLLEDLKKNRMLPGQFRMRTLLWAIVAFSVLLTLPRIFDWEYRGFFLFLWISAFGMAPLLALAGALFYLHWTPWKRWLLSGACFALATVPFLIYAAAQGPVEAIPQVVFATCMFFWLPQSLCIAGVWFFLFRRPRR